MLNVFRVTGLVLASVIISFRFPAASANDYDQARKRIDILGQESMLAYRMTKSACLVMMGSDAKVHAEVTLTSATMFQDMLNALTNGSEKQGLAPEPDPELRQKLQKVQVEAVGLTASASQVSVGDIHSVPVALLLHLNQGMSEETGEMMHDLIEREVEHGLPLDLGNAIFLTHRLNTLFQKGLRDLCMIQLHVDEGMAHDDLFETMEEIEHLLHALSEGDTDLSLPEAPDARVKTALGKIKHKWRNLIPILDAAYDGKPVELKEMHLASVIGDGILKDITSILEHYKKL